MGSYFYIEWSEAGSSDPSGYYHCTATEYHSDTITYVREGATERVNLHSVFWSFTRKDLKVFLPFRIIFKAFSSEESKG